MSYVVYLYVEGPPCDGEEFVCGPFGDEGLAEDQAEQLRERGTAIVLPLFPDFGAVLAEIE